MGALNIEEKLDILAQKITSKLYSEGFLEGDYFNEKKFYEHRELIKKFDIPKTSVTTTASRILFSIGDNFPANVVVGAGTYTGHALGWLIGSNSAKHIYALDIDSVATGKANSNFNLVEKNQVSCLNVDAEKWIEDYDGLIDILYIDVDTEELGKRKYVDILLKAYNKLAPRSIIIAHDINEKKFADDMTEYIKLISDTNKFTKSINLNIDDYGLAITQKR